MKKALAKSLANIKASGMSHIKYELEASLGRSSRRINWACTSCEGDRLSICSSCTGTGAVLQRNLFDPNSAIECGTCSGSGGQPCTACGGRGSRGNFADLETCQRFIENELALEVHGKTIEQLEQKTGLQGYKALGFVNFARFYYDGSVDSELTITTPIEHGDKAEIILKAFKKLADIASDKHVDTRGAGMHIAVLPEGCEGRYPSDTYLNARGLRNFHEQVTKLLPALYFVGTAGHRSRSMQYRTPRVSDDSKYSAIYTLRGRVFEFRVFETCYDRTEAVFEYIQVISNALKFYANPDLKVKSLGKKFGFPGSNEIAHYYSTAEQLRILNATVKYLKPEDKSFKLMKAERNVNYTIKSLAVKEKSRLGQLRSDYQEYKKNWEYIQARPLNEREQADVDWLMAEEDYNEEKARKRIIERRQGRLVPMSEFIQRNLIKQRFSQTVSV